MKYITSDLHFGHTRIMEFCPQTRGHFKDVEHMNESMIADWNSIVGDADEVFILGDVAFLPAQKAINIMNCLNGKKILISGNHDRKLLKDAGFRACFAEIHTDWIGSIDGTHVHMYHFPISEFDQQHRGAVHFHGHLHGGKSGLEEYRVRDMGYDATGFIVVPMDRAIADAKYGKIKGHH